MLSTVASYRMITSDLDRSLSNTAKEPVVSRETDYYLAHIGDVKSVDDLLGDSRLYNYVMKAFGLGDMAYAKAFMRKVMSEGVNDQDAFANKLADPRYKALATTFDFASFGAATTAFDRTQQGTVDQYVRQTMEEEAGAQNDGTRLALYFDRKASSITSAYSILADPALLKVVQTALNLPTEMSLADIDQQAKMIDSRLDVADFQDPAKVGTFLNRFAALYDLQNPPTPPIVPSILIGQSSASGVGSGILAALQNLKLGGI